jgi:hypothetical protein
LNVWPLSPEEKDVAKAEEIAKEAATEDKKKGMPTLASPGVRIPEVIRAVIAKLCLELGESFSILTVKMWEARLKAEGRIPKDLKIDYKAVGGIKKMREDIESKDKTISDLQKQIAELRAARK